MRLAAAHVLREIEHLDVRLLQIDLQRAGGVTSGDVIENLRAAGPRTRGSERSE
jgi:hypothetical protein